jgi:phosphatidylglycerol:prolipoprotein diacylglycerol transferase
MDFIDPIIYTFKIGGFELALRWYGVLVMTGVAVGAWVAEMLVNRLGEDGERIWDALLWIVPIGIIGARLWYVVNATFGGNMYYVDNPAKILAITEGGLHFYGGLLFGAVVLMIYLRKYKLDPWLFLDAVAPVTLLGQAIARPANYINQELYGQPTTLPWGIHISAAHRYPEFADLTRYPVATTLFHPTFAYEIVWNLLAFSLLIYIWRKYVKQVKPGTMFFGWLVLAGVGRFLIEFFRPDQPKLGDFWMTTTQLFALLMALAGALLLAARYGKLNLPFKVSWPDAYLIQPQKK